MGLLDGQIASAIYNGFKGKLLRGTLRKFVVDEAVGLNTKGDPIAVNPVDYTCEGFVDEYSEFFRAQTGIPDTDCKVCIFAKSLSAGVRPLKDDLAQFQSMWYQLKSVSTDPAQALWECRASRLPALSDECRTS